jgi:hypothetical protein
LVKSASNEMGAEQDRRDVKRELVDDPGSEGTARRLRSAA